MVDDLAVVQVKDPHRVMGLTSALSRRARVEQELAVQTELVVRHVTVAEDDDPGIGKLAPQPRCPPVPGPAVVNHANPDTGQLEPLGARQDAFQAVIVVAKDPVGRGDGAQRLEQAVVNYVTGVEDDVSLVEQVIDLLG
jgi:hypothetical protein